MNAKMSQFVLDYLFQNSDDGFIVVDSSGVILEINETYRQFLGKEREQIIGHPIKNVISTTTMYDVLENRRNDKNMPIHVQAYGKGDTYSEDEPYAIGNRFCIYDEHQNLIGAAAHLKFRQRSLDISQKIRETELTYYKEEYQKTLFEQSGFSNFIGNSPKIVHLKETAMRAAKTDFPVLITGETGTGKEVMAKSIHLESNRRKQPFVAINCGAIPNELLESELFGYEDGAFTGAKKGGKVGKFEQANGGTLFLDEIGDMPFKMQVKLLRVLQERELERVGGMKTIPIDVRIISATRLNLFDMMNEGTFREDLYYRLAVMNLQTVPLRECPQDILSHAYRHLDKLNQQYHTEVIISDRAKMVLQTHTWPGNVRELQNVISSAYAMCENSIITTDNLPHKISASADISSLDEQSLRHQTMENACLKEMMNHYEETLLRQALEKTEGNMTEAANLLGLERSLFYKKLKKYNIK